MYWKTIAFHILQRFFPPFFPHYYVDIGERFITICRQRKWLPTTALTTIHFMNCDYRCSQSRLILFLLNSSWVPAAYSLTNSRGRVHPFKNHRSSEARIDHSTAHYIVKIHIKKKICIFNINNNKIFTYMECVTISNLFKWFELLMQ